MRGRASARSSRRRLAEEAAAPTAESRVGAEHPALPLQRSAGNRAVVRMLAARAEVARQPRPGAPEGASRGAAQVTIAGVGAFDAQFVVPGRYRSTSGKAEESVLESMVVTKLTDELSPVLGRLYDEARVLSVEIRLRGLTVRFRDAIISSIQHSSHGGAGDPTQSIEFAGTGELEFEQ